MNPQHPSYGFVAQERVWGGERHRSPPLPPAAPGAGQHGHEGPCRWLFRSGVEDNALTQLFPPGSNVLP